MYLERYYGRGSGHPSAQADRTRFGFGSIFGRGRGDVT